MALLLQRGADTSLADSEGITPLMTACIGACVESLRLLLQHGVDVLHERFLAEPVAGTLGYSGPLHRASPGGVAMSL